MTMQQQIYTGTGRKTIFFENCELATFSIVVSQGSIFTLLTSIDSSASGILVEDPFYKNYKYNAQGTILYPGKFVIDIISKGASGIMVQCKTYSPILE
jgi:hypothetical protein